MKFALSLLIAMALARPAEALEWRWSYQGEGVSASALDPKDKPDADGFYESPGLKAKPMASRLRACAAGNLDSRQRRLPGRQFGPGGGPAALAAWLRLRARRRNVRQSLLRRPFRPAVRLRLLLRSGAPQDQRTRGDVHRDDQLITVRRIAHRLFSFRARVDAGALRQCGYQQNDQRREDHRRDVTTHREAAMVERLVQEVAKRRPERPREMKAAQKRATRETWVKK